MSTTLIPLGRLLDKQVVILRRQANATMVWAVLLISIGAIFCVVAFSLSATLQYPRLLSLLPSLISATGAFPFSNMMALHRKVVLMDDLRTSCDDEAELEEETVSHLTELILTALKDVFTR